MEAQLVMRVVEGGIKLVRPVDAAPIDDHDDLCAGLADYVDNNSTPTIASNLLQENTFLSLLSLLSGRQALRASVRCDNRPYLLLLCATIPVIGDNPTPYPSLAVASVEACDAKKSAKARRAIMPRFALRPVWLSSQSR